MIIIEIKCRVNVRHLNHPQTIPSCYPGAWKKMSPMNPVPGAKKAGPCWSRVKLRGRRGAAQRPPRVALAQCLAASASGIIRELVRDMYLRPSLDVLSQNLHLSKTSR